MPAKKTKTENNDFSFETALERLNAIAEELEEKNPPLDKALSLYEESAGLLKLCSEKLKNAQAKITLLNKD
ncbi:MAG: exodeoxyribonuclease VII small subunit [Clostridia bacterium]|nr:exodeoxyribonuclease VII small subunit [Clostridia bacterium]